MTGLTALLLTKRKGDASGVPTFILHERYGDMADLETIYLHTSQPTLGISVRSLRTQTGSGHGEPVGYYWYLGDVDYPELTSLGDSLGELEELFLHELNSTGVDKIGLYGTGESALMATLLAGLWPSKIAFLEIVGLKKPRNLERIPLTLNLADVTVSGSDVSDEAKLWLTSLGAILS